MNLYETLGANPDSSDKEIKAAYKKAAHRAHPDRETGDAEAFRQVQVAYDVLSDSDRRARYDQTGEVDDAVKNIGREAESLVLSMLDQALDINFACDIAEFIRDRLRDVISDERNKELKAAQKIKALEKKRDRVICKHGENLYQIALESRIAEQEELLRQTVHKIEVMNLALAILQDYEDVKPEDKNHAGSAQSALAEMIGDQFRSGFFNSGFRGF